jgi:two-component system OmpR family sensor kinase
MPLRVRLGLVTALGTAAVIATVGLGFLLQLRASLDTTLDAGLRDQAVTLSRQLVSDGVGALRLDEGGNPVQVLTADGRVVVTSPALGPGPVLDETQRRAALGAPAGAGLTFTAGSADQRTRFVAEPVPELGQILVVGTVTGISDAADDHVEEALLVAGPIAVLVAGVGGWWLTGEALRPVERMRRQAAAMSERDDEATLVVPRTRDELAALATTMNTMLDGLRAALRHERAFVADAGHELRTPLATLRAELELASRPGRSREELQDAVHGAAEETDRIIHLAEDLLLLARAEDDRGFLDRRPTDLGAVALAAARAASALGQARGVTVAVEGAVHLVIDGDPDRLRQALDNVLANAVHHSPDGTAVTVEVGDRPGGHAGLTVADRGPGFPPEFLPHAFERFRRADTARARAHGGTGLGLAIVETIVRAHHGRVEAANRDDGGAVVEIVLPRGDVPSAPEDAAMSSTSPPGRADAGTPHGSAWGRL